MKHTTPGIITGQGQHARDWTAADAHAAWARWTLYAIIAVAALAVALLA